MDNSRIMKELKELVEGAKNVSKGPSFYLTLREFTKEIENLKRFLTKI